MSTTSMNDTLSAPARPGIAWSALFFTVVAGLLAVAPLAGLPSFFQSLAIEVMIFSILAMSLDILLGYTGLVSFGHATFFAVAGYGFGIAASRISPEILVSMPIGIVAAVLIAIPVGWLSIRLSGFYFLMITFAFAQMVFVVAYRWNWLTGGSDGMLVPGSRFFGEPVLGGREEIYYFTLVCFVLTFVALSWIVRSPFGRALVGIRESAPRMRALGYDVRNHKLAAIVIGAAFGALAGVLNAMFNFFVAPESAHWTQSALVLVMVLIGGAGTLVGPIVGATVVLLLQHWLSSYTEYWGLVLGLLFIGLITFAREGLVGIVQNLKRRLSS